MKKNLKKTIDDGWGCVEEWIQLKNESEFNCLIWLMNEDIENIDDLDESNTTREYLDLVLKKLSNYK